MRIIYWGRMVDVESRLKLFGERMGWRNVNIKCRSFEGYFVVKSKREIRRNSEGNIG